MKKAVIGIDLGGTNIKSVLLALPSPRILYRGSRPTQAQAGVARVVENIALEIESRLSDAQNAGYQVKSAGIGSAGLVDRGVVRNSPNLPGWQGAVPLKRLLEKRLFKHRLQITIENDANAFVVAEQRLGAAKGLDNVIGLTLGTGVGGGIIINGRLYRGASGGAGELGHMAIKSDGPKCKCGNQGCLESLIGAQAIINRYNDLRFRAHLRIETGITVKEIVERARRRDSQAALALGETGRLLGVGLANIANIFNPQAVVIGGGVAQAGKIILKPAIDEMTKRAMPYNIKRIKILPAILGQTAGALGAALISVTD
jgi:glucokinase